MMRRREIEHHLDMMTDIRGILGAMKTLALLEIRKLGRRMDAHRRVLDGINAAADDFVPFFPQVLPGESASYHAYLLFGSERGFCADFNDAILQLLAAERTQSTSKMVLPLAVGSKLYNRMEERGERAIFHEGPNVTEEVDGVLTHLIHTLTGLQRQYGPLALTALYHSPEKRAVASVQVLPPFGDLARQGPRFGYPPLLNVEPEGFGAELLDHYLLAKLHDLAYSSLLAENQRRMGHLDGAISRLDEKCAALDRKRNALRQEEITEEIEVILLSTEVAQPPTGDESPAKQGHVLDQP
ncbi:MAG TPA: F0F1 ATP synthase subunit gamma [Gammaproteobacteria bacterium]|nr:F0F1 ATP synthase subunit gamma [Gammaproteobacteria bacterium]